LVRLCRQEVKLRPAGGQCSQERWKKLPGEGEHCEGEEEKRGVPGVKKVSGKTPSPNPAGGGGKQGEESCGRGKGMGDSEGRKGGWENEG